MSNSSKASKALKAARLAAGAMTDGESTQAGSTAGRLAFEAGMTVAELDSAVPGLLSSDAWGAVVDGYYDARDSRRVTESQVQDLCRELTSGGSPTGEATVRLMWEELLAMRRATGAV